MILFQIITIRSGKEAIIMHGKFVNGPFIDDGKKTIMGASNLESAMIQIND